MNKYTCIVKINNDKFLKYRLKNLIKFTQFLDDKWSDWKYYNVYDKEKKQIGNFTKNKKPLSPRID